ncbi:MAG: hypothetical protein K8T89_22195, partial [Planctomycetes bacterium]|nr:hypothetical protein [Planctomycetota bacterium]
DAGLTPLTAFLNADGCPRAFTFTGVVSPTGGKVTLQPVLGPRIKVRAEEFSSAATPLPVLLEVDQPPEGATVLLELGLADGQELKPDVVKRLPFAKTKSVAVKLMSEGVIQFRTTLADLKTTLAVEQLAGTRLLRASLLDSSRKVIAQDTVTVVFDGSAPTGVAFVDPVARARRDLPLPVKATCDPPLSGVKEVRFFVGKPVNDAPPPMAAMTPGEPTDATGRFWTAKLLVGEAKGPTPISVQFTARGGRSSIATITVDLLDAAEFNKPIPGKIIGKVREGTLDQPGMIVILRDAKGAEKARTKTRENGTYEFLDVPPGKYSVFTNKTSTNRSANKVIEVKAAEEVSVILELLL